MKNVLDICLDLHQFNMGSHEPDMSDTEYRTQYNLLVEKHKNWKNPNKHSIMFDNATKSLILATILECDMMNVDIIIGDTDKEN